MKKYTISRRDWLIGASCVGLGMIPACGIQTPRSVDDIGLDPYPRNATEALLRLKIGNRRFMEDKSIHTHENASWRNLLVEGQKPFATVLGC
jgi:carbonic anhydrase